MTKQDKNDKTILTLKKQIADKKKALKTSKRFSPVTNCSIELDGVRFNIQTLNKDQIVFMLVRLNCYKMSAEDLEIVDDCVISGFPVESWIKDLQAKLMNVNRNVEEKRLKTLENRLHNLLSLETKVELEIDDIASSIE